MRRAIQAANSEEKQSKKDASIKEKLSKKDTSKKSSVYYVQAFESLKTLRHTKLQAARDLVLMNHQLKEEARIREHTNPFRELFTQPRNSRALLASLTCMFFQQVCVPVPNKIGVWLTLLYFCGVNIIPYYSTTILLTANENMTNALLAGMGFGIINFVFALPAFWTIDSFGRRKLLLSTFPFMAASHVIIAIAFASTNPGEVQRALVLTGMYLFGIAYSPAEGPVPFVYAAESMALYNRDYGN